MSMITREQLIEDLKTSTQNSSGMFEIGEETICALMSLLTTPAAPVSVPDERYQNLSELYHSQEKRLFKLTQRIKGPSFDKYAHSPSQAIDVLASAIFGDGEEDYRSAMLHGVNGTLTNERTIPASTPCKDAPEHIWLQTAGVWPENGEFSELTWCSDNQHKDDTLYVRADVVNGNSPVVADGLLTVCADAYQVVGVMADALGIFDDEAVQKVMDNLSQQKLIHSDVLPFSIPSAPHKAVTQALTKGMERYGDAMQELAKREVIPDCSCRTCRPVTFSDSRFVVCPECGNKRCPHANDHRHACTGSNEPGQEGSAYPAAPQQEAKS